MRKLLSAGFLRLRKNSLFLVGLFAMFGLGLFFSLGKYSDMVRFGAKQYLDDVLFLHTIFAGCCSAIFCSLFTGLEFSDGTIRNKLIVGHSRINVYFSNLIICILAAFCMTVSFLLSYCLFGIPLLLPPKMPVNAICFYMFISLFTITAYVSFFHMISILTGKKAVSAVVCLLVFMGLFLAAASIYSRIKAPEYITDYFMTASGMQESEPYPNPKFLTGMAKRVYLILFDFLPSGQSIQLACEEVMHPALIALYSVLTTILTTIMGIFCFRKKDLK